MLESGTWIATGFAVACAVLMPFFARRPLRSGFVVGGSVAAALWHARLDPSPRSPIEHVALSCAALSLGWVSIATAAPYVWRRPKEAASEIGALARAASLLFGVVAAVLLSVQLGMRGAFVLADLLNGFSNRDVPEFGYSIMGVWSLGLLVVAATISLLSRRDQRLLTGVFVLGVMLLTWVCLLMPVYASTATGGYERTGATLALQLCWAGAVLFAASVATVRESRRARASDRVAPFAACDSPSTYQSVEEGVALAPSQCSHRQDAGSTPTMSSSLTGCYPGMRLCCGVLAIAIALLICYHLVVPIRWGGRGFWFSGLASALSSALTAGACYRWLRFGWSGLLFEAGLGVVTVGICSVATTLALIRAESLQSAYPMLFNAVMAGLCAAAMGYGCLAAIGQDRENGVRELTMTGRMIHHLRRFTFLSASLAFFVGVVMMIWPRLPTVAVTDDSLGRVCAGVGGNLLLLLVVLWCSRRLRQPAFHLLTVLSIVSLGGFLLVRILPFSSRVY